MIAYDRAMTSIELAIRRVSSRLKGQVPWDMAVTEALDALSDEIATLAEEARRSALPSHYRGET